MVKLILYVFVIPVVVISMDSVNFNAIFKKGQSNYYHARLVYMFIVAGISYLVVNFIVDVLGVFS